MIRTLLIITGASLVLCAAAAAGAAALGGNDLARNGWAWTFRDAEKNQTVTFERSDKGPTVVRNLPWTGGDRLTIEIPGDIIYVQGSTPSVVLTGQQSMVDRVRLVDGRLTYVDGDDVGHVVFGWSVHDRLKVVVTAPSVRTFQLDSSADLSIRDYDQPALNLTISGFGEVDATGRTDTLTLDLSGSGGADLDSLTTKDATIDVNGFGDVRVAPTGKAEINISGSGDVTLTERPAELTQRISGFGEVRQD